MTPPRRSSGQSRIWALDDGVWCLDSALDEASTQGALVAAKLCLSAGESHHADDDTRAYFARYAVELNQRILDVTLGWSAITTNGSTSLRVTDSMSVTSVNATTSVTTDVYRWPERVHKRGEWTAVTSGAFGNETLFAFVDAPSLLEVHATASTDCGASCSFVASVPVVKIFGEPLVNTLDFAVDDKTLTATHLSPGGFGVPDFTASSSWDMDVPKLVANVSSDDWDISSHAGFAFHLDEEPRTLSLVSEINDWTLVEVESLTFKMPWGFEVFESSTYAECESTCADLGTGVACIMGANDDRTVRDKLSGCVDTDSGAVDPYGHDCNDYVANPGWCGNYDDDDFTSSEMCCACASDGRADDSKCSSYGNDCCACDASIGMTSCGWDEAATCDGGYVAVYDGDDGGWNCDYSCYPSGGWTNRYGWIGINNIDEDQNWVWPDSCPSTYGSGSAYDIRGSDQWCDNQPCVGDCDGYGDDQHCAFLNWDYAHTCNWVDAGCDADIPARLRRWTRLRRRSAA